MRAQIVRLVLVSVVTIISAGYWSSPASAQPQPTGVIGGLVLDASEGTPLPGAAVHVDATSFRVATDRDGTFRIVGVHAGDQTLSVSYLGHHSLQARVHVVAGAVTTVEVLLPRQRGFVTETYAVVAPIDDAGTRALNQQRTAPNIVNVVSADQLGWFPDANAAEAAQRIPGISIERDQGEGRYVAIRGTEARLNSTMLNGERIPSPEGDVRQVALDVVPTDLIEAIEVSKALTPDMDADAIGGAVNLVTKTATSRPRTLATFATGYNDIQNDWAQALFSLTAGRRFMDGTLGLIGTGSYSEDNRGAENIEPEYDDGALDDLQVRDYTVNRQRTGLSGALDYRFSPNSTMFARGVLSRFADQESRRRTRYRIGDDRIERELKDRLETQRIGTVQAGASHFVANGVQLDYRVSASYAEEREPDRHDTTFRQDDVGFAPNVSASFIDPNNIQANPLNEDLALFGFDEQVVANNLTHDRDIVGALDVRVPLIARSNLAGTMKVGAKYRDKRKMRDNNATVFESADDLFLSDFVDPTFNVGSILNGRYVPGQHIGADSARTLRSQFEFEGELDLEENLADYTATERTAAVYALTELALGPRMSLLSGVRVESTRIGYTGFELRFDEEGDAASLDRASDSRTYTQVFPSMHWRYALTPDSNLRIAATRSMARPNYSDLVPFQLILEEDSEIVRGNSTLRPTTSWNLDAMVEHYFRSVGVVSGGVFHKTLSDFIFPFTFEELRGENMFDVIEPRNGSEARVTGVELAFQNQLRALPAPFDGLGVYANYTFTDSRATLPVREGNGPLPGQSRHVGNLSASYEKAGFSARTSLNVRGRSLVEVGEDTVSDILIESHHQLDLSVTHSLSDSLRIFLDVLNVTDRPLRLFEGTADRPVQMEYYGAWMMFGVKLNY